MRFYIVATVLALSSFVFAQERTASKTLDAASQVSPTDSTSVLSKIVALAANNGTDSELSAEMAGALGYTGDGQPWPYRQIAARTDEADLSSPGHIFAMSRGSGGDLFIYTRSEGTSHFIRAGRDGQVKKGIALGGNGESATPIAIADAQEDMNAELRFWDRNADEIVHWWTCTGELAGAHPVTAEMKIEACTWLIQSGKETPRGVAMAYTNRGMAYGGDNKQKEKEMEDLNQAVKVDPTSANAWAQLCSAQNWVSEEAQLAIQSCSKSIELDPHSAEGWTFRGDISLKAKDYDLAIEDYDQAILLAPDWMWPLDNRGEAYLRESKFDLAIADFNSVIRVSPDYAMGFLDRGIAEIRKNDLDAALADFQTGIRIDPKCGSCIFGQGLVKRAKGDTAGGNADIARAKAMAPKAADDFVVDGIAVP